MNGKKDPSDKREDSFIEEPNHKTTVYSIQTFVCGFRHLRVQFLEQDPNVTTRKTRLTVSDLSCQTGSLRERVETGLPQWYIPFLL